MVTSILIAIDGSAWSQSAIQTALWIAERAQGRGVPVRLIGLHIVSVTRIRGRWLQDLAGLIGFEPVVVPEAVEAHYMASGRALLTAFEEQAQARGIQATTVLEQGSVSDRLVHHADKADLLIIGTKGETEEEFVGQGGGTAERVVRRASCSTLVVPLGAREVRGILLAFDGTDGANVALRAVQRLNALCGVPVDVVHVANAPQDVDPLDEARADLAGPLLRSVQQVSGEPREVLAAEAVRLGCDTVAVGYRGRSKVKDLMIGRTVEWLLGRVELTIFVCR